MSKELSFRGSDKPTKDEILNNHNFQNAKDDGKDENALKIR
jgi:hypothetical protein